MAEQLALLKKHLRLPELTIISDRATYSAGHLLQSADEWYAALVAAPWNEFQELFDKERTKPR